MAEKKKRTLADVMRQSASRAKGSDPYSGAGAGGGAAAKKATKKVYSKKKEDLPKKKKKVYSKEEIKKGVSIEDYRKHYPKKKDTTRGMGEMPEEQAQEQASNEVSRLQTKKAKSVDSGLAMGSPAASRQRVLLTKKEKRKAGRKSRRKNRKEGRREK
jgi:hypothetical protein